MPVRCGNRHRVAQVRGRRHVGAPIDRQAGQIDRRPGDAVQCREFRVLAVLPAERDSQQQARRELGGELVLDAVGVHARRVLEQGFLAGPSIGVGDRHDDLADQVDVLDVEQRLVEPDLAVEQFRFGADFERVRFFRVGRLLLRARDRRAAGAHLVVIAAGLEAVRERCVAEDVAIELMRQGDPVGGLGPGVVVGDDAEGVRAEVVPVHQATQLLIGERRHDRPGRRGQLLHEHLLSPDPVLGVLGDAGTDRKRRGIGELVVRLAIERLGLLGLFVAQHLGIVVVAAGLQPGRRRYAEQPIDAEHLGDAEFRIVVLIEGTRHVVPVADILRGETQFLLPGLAAVRAIGVEYRDRADHARIIGR